MGEDGRGTRRRPIKQGLGAASIRARGDKGWVDFLTFLKFAFLFNHAVPTI
jgi:hypothetical protein